MTNCSVNSFLIINSLYFFICLLSLSADTDDVSLF